MGASWRGESVKQGEGCLNSTSTSTSTSRSRPWVATHTGLRGGLSPPPLRTPGSFHCALPLAGCVSGAPPIAANAAAARSSHFRFGPARKNTLAVSHRSFDVVLSAARGYVKRRFSPPPAKWDEKNKAKPNTFPLTLKCHWPRSKITPKGEVENRASFCAGCNPTGGHRAAAGFCGNSASP